MAGPANLYSVSLTWQTPPTVVADKVKAWGAALPQMLEAVLTYYAQAAETFAKQNAPWTDRTGAARQGLRATVEVTKSGAGHVGVLSLIHGVTYGIWLELAHGGKYAIIERALQAQYGAIMQTLQEQLG